MLLTSHLDVHKPGKFCVTPRIIFVLDTSGSMSSHVTRAMDAVLTTLMNTGYDKNEQVEMIEFNSDAYCIKKDSGQLLTLEELGN